MTDFCHENGLLANEMYSVARSIGKAKSHKGWTAHTSSHNATTKTSEVSVDAAPAVTVVNQPGSMPNVTL